MVPDLRDGSLINDAPWLKSRFQKVIQCDTATCIHVYSYNTTPHIYIYINIYIYTYRQDMSESKSPTEGVISIWHMSLHLVILKTKRIRSCHASFLPLAAPLGILQRRWICGTPIQRSGPACPKLNAPRTGGIGEVSLVCYPFGNMFSTRLSESVCHGQEKLKEVIANVTWL